MFPRALWLKRLLLLLVGLLLAELLLRAVGSGARLATGRGGGLERSPDAPAILCIGDSCVWGPNFDPERSYPARLEALLARATGPRAIALNYGSPGRPSWEVPRDLVPLLERRRFAAVLVTVGVNNIWRDPDAERGVAWVDDLRLWKLVRLVAARLRDTPKVDPSKPAGAVARATNVLDEAQLEPQLRRDLESARDAARARGVPLYVVCYATDGGSYGIANRCLRAAAAELRIPLVDPEPAARELARRAGPERVYFTDLHPRPVGYEVVARVAYEELRKAGVHAGPAFPDPLVELEAELDARRLIELETTASGVSELVLRDGPPGARCLAFAWEDPSWGGSEHPLPTQAELAPVLGADLAAGKLPKLGVAFVFDASGEARLPLAALLPDEARLAGYPFQVTYVALRATPEGEQLIPNSIAPPTRLVRP